MMDVNFERIELETWKRKGIFEEFQKFHSPVFDVTVNLNVRPLFEFANARDKSFFLLTLFAISKAMNAVPEFRQRFLEKTAVAQYDVVHPTTPILCEQSGYFTLTQLEYLPTFAEFEAFASIKIKEAQQADVSKLLKGQLVPNCFCASCIPWISGGSMTAAIYELNQDMPLITWFKMDSGGMISISLRCNHSFIDGQHFAEFFNTLENYFAHPEEL